MKPCNMKTILEFYNIYPEPYKSQALANLYPNMANKNVSDPIDALIVGFYWERTPQGQGFKYWENFCNKLKKQYDKI